MSFALPRSLEEHFMGKVGLLITTLIIVALSFLFFVPHSPSPYDQLIALIKALICGFAVIGLGIIAHNIGANQKGKTFYKNLSPHEWATFEEVCRSIAQSYDVGRHLALVRKDILVVMPDGKGGFCVECRKATKKLYFNGIKPEFFQIHITAQPVEIGPSRSVEIAQNPIPVATDETGSSEKEDEEKKNLIALRDYIKRRSPSHGEILFSTDVSYGSPSFQVSKLTFKKMPYDRSRGQFYHMWWVSGSWNVDGEKQDVPLPMFFQHCRYTEYPKIASIFIQALWKDSGTPNDALGQFNLALLVIAVPPDIFEPRSPITGLWPHFEGDWELIKRFGQMQAEHIRIFYFGYCYQNFGLLRSLITEAIENEPMPRATHAKLFTEACGEFWNMIYLMSDERASNALGTHILAVSREFQEYPVVRFERDKVENLCNLFSEDKYNFLTNVIKEGKQKIAGMMNLKIKTTGPWIQPFDDENNRAARIEIAEKDKIEKTIKWCEIELNPMEA